MCGKYATFKSVAHVSGMARANLLYFYCHSPPSEIIHTSSYVKKTSILTELILKYSDQEPGKSNLLQFSDSVRMALDPSLVHRTPLH